MAPAIWCGFATALPTIQQPKTAALLRSALWSLILQLSEGRNKIIRLLPLAGFRGLVPFTSFSSIGG